MAGIQFDLTGNDNLTPLLKQVEGAMTAVQKSIDSITKTNDALAASNQKLSASLSPISSQILKTQESINVYTASLDKAVLEKYKMIGAIGQASRAFGEDSAAVDRARAAYDLYKAKLDQTRATISILQGKLLDLYNQFYSDNAAIDSNNQAYADNQAEIMRLLGTLGELESDLQDVRGAFQSVGGGTTGGGLQSVFEGIDVALAAIQPELEAVVAAFKIAFNAIASVASWTMNFIGSIFQTTFDAIRGIVSWTLDFIGGLFRATFDAARNIVGGALDAIGNAFQTVFGAIGNIIQIVLGINLAGLLRSAAAGIRELALEAWNAAADFQMLQIQINGLLAVQEIQTGVTRDMAKALADTAQPARDLIDWISTMAIKSSITVEELTTMARSLLSIGVGIEPTKELLTAFGNLAAGLGLTNEKINAVEINLTQTSRAMKITERDLREYGNAGLPVTAILDLMAQNLGITREAAIALSKDGLNGVNAFNAAVVAFAEKYFPKSMEMVADTWKIALSNIHDIIQSIFGKELLGPALEPIGRFVNWILQGILSMRLQFRAWGVEIGKIFSAVLDNVKFRDAILAIVVDIGKIGTAIFNLLGIDMGWLQDPNGFAAAVVDFLNNKALPAFDRLVNFFEVELPKAKIEAIKFKNEVVKAFQELMTTTIDPLISSTGDLFGSFLDLSGLDFTSLSGFIKSLTDLIFGKEVAPGGSDSLGNALGITPERTGGLIEAFKTLVDTIKTKFGELQTYLDTELRPSFDNIIHFFTVELPQVRDNVGGILLGLQTLFQPVTDAAGGLLEKLTGLTGLDFSSFGGFVKSITDAILGKEPPPQEVTPGLEQILGGRQGGLINALDTMVTTIKTKFGELKTWFDSTGLGDAIGGIATAITAIGLTVSGDTSLDTLQTRFSNLAPPTKMVHEALAGIAGSLIIISAELVVTNALLIELGVKADSTNKHLLFWAVIIGFITAPIVILNGIIAALVGAFNGLLTALIILRVVWDDLKKRAQDFLKALTDLTDPLKTGKTDWDNLWKAIFSIIAIIADVIALAFTPLLAILLIVGGAIGGFVSAVIGAFQGMKNDLVGNSIIPEMIDGILREFYRLVELPIIVWIYLNNVMSVFLSMMGNITLIIYGKVQEWIQVIKDTYGQWVSLGIMLMSGLINGLWSMFGQLMFTAQWIAQQIAATIQGALDIRSPSRVFMNIGRQVMEGLQIGMTQPISPIVQPILQGLGAVPGLISGGGVGLSSQASGGRMQVTINFTGGGAAGALLEQMMRETAYEAFAEIIS